MIKLRMLDGESILHSAPLYSGEYKEITRILKSERGRQESDMMMLSVTGFESGGRDLDPRDRDCMEK